MRKLLLLSTALALVTPRASQAQLSLGARVGFAPAMGDAFEDKVTGQAAKMSDGVKSQVPIQLDAAYRLTPELSVGAYFSYGFGQVGGDTSDLCDAANLDCSARSIRAGLQGFYTFQKLNPRFAPWLGLGIGWEWTNLKAEGQGLTNEISLDGLEIVNLQVGADYKVNSQLAVGPYIMYSVGRYSGGTEKLTGFPDEDVFATNDETIHSWLGFGLRGRFDL